MFDRHAGICHKEMAERLYEINRRKEQSESVWYDKNQSRELFLASFHDFYGKMGQKDFWEGGARARSIVYDAFVQDYLRTEHGNYAYQDAVSFEAAMREFGARELYMVTRLGR